MKVTAAAVLALAATVAADNVRFTRAAPAQLGRLARREDDGAYEPELLECGEGNTCAEACGAGYEQCESSASENHCFNPAAGETCCTFLGLGSSCNAGYFCAHDVSKSTVCCAEGSSLEECATLNKANGALTSDPPVPSTTETATETESSAEPTEPATTTGSFNSTTTFVPSSTKAPINGTSSAGASTTRTGTTPSTIPSQVPPESGAASLVPATAAALFLVGAFAALF
ncbi:hypothetical protein SAPIO_CDS7198 [Scedosporium apiospermum]|uniref:Prp 4 c domain-containing protein n=1 Tax=Pseudallescheria apiosperma TaxID=563466 RepID=A0A084G1B8_PSEDA|nr:uncharacterized protein SAPIO_CDS7198 [Scedosporium apiospermum]KEZ41130.1 hypothetical protein SAPIO_CDS7198 [Scedosporium apiospermum]